MITVCGETVADLVGQGGDVFRAHPGGSPANVAVALARLGDPVSLLARIGPDVFGRRMREHLLASGVDGRHLVAASQPSTLAAVSLDPEGRASYDFWLDGTADWQWTDDELAAHPAPGVVALHTGSLASWTPPGAQALQRLLTRARSEDAVTLTYDPNVRPSILGTSTQARDAVEPVVGLAHVVKVSDEDLAHLYPGEDPVDAAGAWLARGAVVVVVTLGPAGAVALRGSARIRVAAPEVGVVDTVGAGDTFQAGLLHALAGLGALGDRATERLQALSDDELAGALRLAATAAALTCTRPGADPPRLDELTARMAAEPA